jgi:predicted nucleotidyltransferase
MIQIEKKHYKIVKEILSRYPYDFYVYGSRAKGTARNLSDLDLCYQENISDSLIFQIEEELKESDLPFSVDLVAWWRMKNNFQALIKKDLIKI